SRTANVADEAASSVTCLRTVMPVDVKRSTSTYLPANARSPVTVTENVPIVALTSFSATSGRTLTVTALLVTVFQLAWYAVWIVGFATKLHAPLVVVLAVARLLNAVFPNGS